MTDDRSAARPDAAASHAGTVTRGAVPFLFGCFDASALPGPVLTACLADLGLAPATARTMLARMVRVGELDVDRAGRIAIYRLGPGLSRTFARVRNGARSPAWPGYFQTVLYDIPESARSIRSNLRETARQNGFAASRPGVLLGFTDPTGWAGAFARDAGAGAHVVTGRFACDVDSARELARRAWRLDEVAAAMRQALAEIGDRFPETDESRSEPTVVLRRFHDALQLAYLAQVRDPQLPPDLLPHDWPAPELDEKFRWLTRRFGRPVHGRITDLVTAAGYADRIAPRH